MNQNQKQNKTKVSYGIMGDFPTPKTLTDSDEELQDVGSTAPDMINPFSQYDLKLSVDFNRILRLAGK